MCLVCIFTCGWKIRQWGDCLVSAPVVIRVSHDLRSCACTHRHAQYEWVTYDGVRSEEDAKRHVRRLPVAFLSRCWLGVCLGSERERERERARARARARAGAKAGAGAGERKRERERERERERGPHHPPPRGVRHGGGPHADAHLQRALAASFEERGARGGGGAAARRR